MAAPYTLEDDEGSAEFEGGALQASFADAPSAASYFPKTEAPSIPASPVDPRARWRAFAGNVLKGHTLAQGLSAATEAYGAQEAKDAELYARYLPIAEEAKMRRAAHAMKQQQAQQAQMAHWNKALLGGAASLLNTPGPLDPRAVQAVTASAVRSGQVPPQLAQQFLSQLPQDPTALRAYVERAAIAAVDPFRALQAPKFEKLGAEDTLHRVGPSGEVVEVAKGPGRKDEMIRLLESAGIDPASPEGRSVLAQYLHKKVTHPPSATTSVVLREEAAESKKVGEFYGEQFADIQKAAASSQRKLANLTRMRQLMTGMSTGKLTPLLKDVAGVAAEFGITFDPKLGAKEAVEALSNEMALQARDPSGGAGMPGAMSDADRKFLQNITPSLSKSPAGNQLILETNRRIAQRSIEVAKLAADYRKRHGTIDTDFQSVLMDYAERNPLFGDLEPESRRRARPAPPPGRIDELLKGVR